MKYIARTFGTCSRLLSEQFEVLLEKFCFFECETSHRDCERWTGLFCVICSEASFGSLVVIAGHFAVAVGIAYNLWIIL